MSEQEPAEDWKHYLRLNADDIEYGSLSDQLLQNFALSSEPYIATLALGELVARRSDRARSVLDELLRGTGSNPNRYVHAAALEGLYELDPNAALQEMATHAKSCDPYVVSSMVDLIEGNEPDVHAEPARSAIAAVVARLRTWQDGDAEITAQRRTNFLDAYGTSGPNG